jgi:energy-converting hydrogenase Eha subunit E
METARHLMVPALQLYLGALLMVLGVLGARSGPDVASGK